MAGRKPKPTEQKIAEGNPGRRELPGSPQFDDIPDEPPIRLSVAAKKTWTYLLAQYKISGMLKATDAFVLAAFCDCYDRYAKAKDRMDRTSYLKEARMLAASLGLSPADRARLGIKGNDERDDLGDFEKRGEAIANKAPPNVLDGRAKFGT